MSIRSRLTKLERAGVSFVPAGNQDASEGDGRALSDEEEADEIGRFLWMTGMIDRKYGHLTRSYPVSAYGDAQRAWDAGMDAALAAGCTEYHTGLRTLAMAVWLIHKPGIQEHRRTHGTWVWDEPPRRADLMTQEEFEALPVGQKIQALRESLGRKGHWTGPRRGARI